MWFLFEAFHQNFLASRASFELPTPACVLVHVFIFWCWPDGVLEFALLGSLSWEPSDLCANFTMFFLLLLEICYKISLCSKDRSFLILFCSRLHQFLYLIDDINFLL
jgi:hypothetical protein